MSEAQMHQPLLEVKGLKEYFDINMGFFRTKPLKAVDDVSLEIEKGEIVCLIKPQFEAGREKVGKKGVVRDPAVHKEVIEKVIVFAKEQYLQPLALDFSPIKGPEGNIEYLLYLQKKPEGTEMTDGDMDVDAVVGQAHGTLDK